MAKRNKRAKISKPLWVQFDNGLPVKVSVDGLDDVSDLIEAIKKKLSNTFADVDVSQLTLSLPDGITRAYSGLDNDKFASDLIEDTILRPGCLLSELADVGTDDRQPFIVKANASKSLSIIVDLNNG